MAKEIHHTDALAGWWSKKLQTPSKHEDWFYHLAVDQKLMFSNWPSSMWELRNRLLISQTSSYFLTDIAYQLNWAILHTHKDITFIVVAPFSPFVCKLARAAVLASSWFCKILTWCHFKTTKDRSSHLPIAHTEFTCKCSLAWPDPRCGIGSGHARLMQMLVEAQPLGFKWDS